MTIVVLNAISDLMIGVKPLIKHKSRFGPPDTRPLCRLVGATRQLIYGTSSDANDEFTRMPESVLSAIFTVYVMS